MQALVTGATGFLGSHLCRRLMAEGFAVRALVRTSSDLAGIENLGCETVTGDITDIRSVACAVSGSSVVIHAAADIGYSRTDASRQREINQCGTDNVARACRSGGVGRLIHVSSVAAVGIPEDSDPAANEEFAFNLKDRRLVYHLSKREAEERVQRQVALGLDAVIVNPASIFGPFGPLYRGGVTMAKVRRGPVVPFFTGGLCTVHIDDVVEAILASVQHGVAGERYILGGENLTYRALVERTARAMGVVRLFVPLPAPVVGALEVACRFRAWHIAGLPQIPPAVGYCASRSQFYDSSKARRELGFAPRGFDAILEEYLRYEARRERRAPTVGSALPVADRRDAAGRNP